MAPAHVVVRLRPGSDGDATHVPSPGYHTQVLPPTLYLEKTAQQWMERRGEARPGTRYILESLPAGYTMWQRPRPGSKILDKYLFGHPDHKKFDSPNRFYPHFEHLMDNGGSSMGCPCTVCGGGVLPLSSRTPSTTSTSQPPTSTPPDAQVSRHFRQLADPIVPTRGRPKATMSTGLDTSRVDEEGTPDVYRNLINKLQRQNTIDEKIEEPLSPDWRAESEILPHLLQELRDNEQWKPRQGEIVLFVRSLPEDQNIARVESKGEYQLYDNTSEKFLGPPLWEAGLVAQTPTKAICYNLGHPQKKADNVIYSGVRLEPLPDPNNPAHNDKHKYVPLQQTRPFFVWEQLLKGIPQDLWHPTILNALTVMSTLSLVGKFRFRGTWPNASIYCHAMYLGSELLAVGDTIRLLPSTSSGIDECCDIMVVSSIRIKWINLDRASSNDYDEGVPYNTSVWIHGTAYTNVPSRSDKRWLSETNTDRSSIRAAADYSQWYPLHPPMKELAIPHTRAMGRLYEQKAMHSFLDSEDENITGLDVGRGGLIKARYFSSTHNQRIVSAEAAWYWGDSRADSLALRTINGLDVAKFDQLRDVQDLRKKIKLLEVATEDSAMMGSRSHSTTKTPGGRDLRRYMAPSLPPTPDRTNTSLVITPSSSLASKLSSGRGPQTGQKRNRADVASDEDDEIRRSTLIVEETSAHRKKQPIIQVVIDD